MQTRVDSTNGLIILQKSRHFEVSNYIDFCQFPKMFGTCDVISWLFTL